MCQTGNGGGLRNAGRREKKDEDSAQGKAGPIDTCRSMATELVTDMMRSVARPSLIPSLCTHFTRAGIEWRR